MMYRNLRVIGQYFFFQNRWPRLIICIDLFVFFLMGEESGDVLFFLKKVSDMREKNFYEAIRLDNIINSTYTTD